MASMVPGMTSDFTDWYTSISCKLASESIKGAKHAIGRLSRGVGTGV
jgi:hypothetical protein